MPRSSQKRSTSCMAASTSGLSQLRSGCSAMNECRYHWPVRSSYVHAGPTAENAETQSFGGPPSIPSRHTYQSRFGSSREDRAASNQAWRSEVWFGTQSSTTRIPRAWHASTSASRSSSDPNCGSTSQ